MIRPAEEKDLRRLVEMASKFYPMTTYASLTPFNDNAAAVLSSVLIESGIVLVAEVDEQVVGMVALALVPFIYDPSIFGAYEVIWWVEPEFQSKGVGKELIAAIDPVAKERGAQYIQMVCMANSPPQAGALYIKAGYDHTETCYTKRI